MSEREQGWLGHVLTLQQGKSKVVKLQVKSKKNGRVCKLYATPVLHIIQKMTMESQSTRGRRRGACNHQDKVKAGASTTADRTVLEQHFNALNMSQKLKIG